MARVVSVARSSAGAIAPRSSVWPWLLVAFSALGCGDSKTEATPSTEAPPAVEPAEDDLTAKPKPQKDFARDIVSTSLSVDITAKTASATIVLAASTSRAASFETQGLHVQSVQGPKGPLLFREIDGRLDVGVPATKKPVSLTIAYTYAAQPNGKLEGQLPSGTTFVWPYFCGNLFPCKADPKDGLRFELALTGIPAGKTAIFPAAISNDAPSYQVAWAVGAYTSRTLGTTPSGTKVSLHTLPGDDAKALAATTHLVDVFAFYERTLGPYSFGPEVGSVSVEWGPSGFGGLEHHPFWHIGRSSIGDAETHFHEAAHGYFGDGVRIACWEDFVLSEGTVSYLTARATEVVVGPAAGKAIWASYQQQLDGVFAGDDRVAWPQSCGTVDVLKDGLFSQAPYMKGAFFYRAVAEAIGAEKLDEALGSFYRAHVGGAASMHEMLDHLKATTGFDAAPLAQVWLVQTGRPN